MEPLATAGPSSGDIPCPKCVPYVAGLKAGWSQDMDGYEAMIAARDSIVQILEQDLVAANGQHAEEVSGNVNWLP